MPRIVTSISRSSIRNLEAYCRVLGISRAEGVRRAIPVGLTSNTLGKFSKPPGYPGVRVLLDLPAPLLSDLDAYCRPNGISRAESIRRCLLVFISGATDDPFRSADQLEQIATEKAGPRVITVPAIPQVLSLLCKNPEGIRHLSPEQLEELVYDRFEAMGFSCARIGSTSSADGGVDLIACPREPTPFPYLLGVQVKSANRGRSTPVRHVRDFVGALTGQPLSGEVLITNTTFTMDAKWFAEQHRALLRLRDLHDLSRWIYDDFAAHELSRETPAKLELRPGLIVKVHEAPRLKRK